MKNKILFMFIILACVFQMSGCSDMMQSAQSQDSAETVVSSNEDPILSEAVPIVLSNQMNSGNGYMISGDTVVIGKGGIYVLSGSLENGQILVEAKNQDVTLVLNGADIHCDDASAILVTKCENFTLYLASGSVNIVSDGAVYVNSSEDAPNACIYSKSDMTVAGEGSLAIHAGSKLSVTAGEIFVTQSYEGLEAGEIDISGGSIILNSTDDGINAAGGVDGSGNTEDDRFFMRGGMDASDGSILTVSGGYLVIYADGDGIDSNGNITMTDGTVLLYGPENNGNGVLDYAGDFTLSGGTLLAVGSSGMAQAPNDVTQYTVSVSLDQTLKHGETVTISCGSKVFAVKLPKDISHLVFSSPELQENETYTIACGGTFDGEFTDNFANEGSVASAEEICSITLTDLLTGYGKTGFGDKSFGDRGKQTGFDRDKMR